MVVYSTLHSGEPFVKFLKPDVPSPKQIEYRKRIRAQGRKHYIVHTGILRFGMSVFVLTTLWSWYEEYGWRVPPRGYLWLSVWLISGLVICSVGGYFWGAYVWRRFLEDPPSEKGISS